MNKKIELILYVVCMGVALRLLDSYEELHMKFLALLMGGVLFGSVGAKDLSENKKIVYIAVSLSTLLAMLVYKII